MFEQLSGSIRRLARGGQWGPAPDAPLIRVGHGPTDIAMAQGDIAMLRGVSSATADVADCTCPESCERDHANE